MQVLWTKYSPRNSSVPTSRRQEERSRTEHGVAGGGDRKPRIYFCGAHDETASRSGGGSGAEATAVSTDPAAGVAHYMRVIALLQVGFQHNSFALKVVMILRGLWPMG